MSEDNKEKNKLLVKVLQIVVAPVAVGLVIAFLTPASPWIQKLIFPPIPPTPPDTKILKVMDGNNLTVTNGGSTPSKSIIIKFTGKDNMGVSSYECSIDGRAFSFCNSPYHYLPNVGMHFFSVRSIDNEGTSDPSPEDYNLTIMTSATVEGVVKRINKPVPFVEVIADKTYNDTTIEGGRFILQNVPRGIHTYEILNKSSPLYRDKFYILEEDSVKDLGVIDIATSVIQPITEGGGMMAAPPAPAHGLPPAHTFPPDKDGGTDAPHPDTTPRPSGMEGGEGPILTGINEAYIEQANVSAGPRVSLMYNESMKEGTRFHNVMIAIKGTPKLLSEIDRVTYYLHPTFKPDVITKYSAQDRFSLSFNAWGQFELKAKAYFKDGNVEDVSKKIVFGSTGQDEEEFNPNFPKK